MLKSLQFVLVHKQRVISFFFAFNWWLFFKPHCLIFSVSEATPEYLTDFSLINNHPFTHPLYMPASSCIGVVGGVCSEPELSWGESGSRLHPDHVVQQLPFHHQLHNVSGEDVLVHCFLVSVFTLSWNYSLTCGLWRHWAQVSAWSGLTFSGTNLCPESKGSILNWSFNFVSSSSSVFLMFSSPLATHHRRGILTTTGERKLAFGERSVVVSGLRWGEKLK